MTNILFIKQSDSVLQTFYFLSLKLQWGGGANDPTFRNSGYGSHMKKKMWYVVNVNLVINF